MRRAAFCVAHYALPRFHSVNSAVRWLFNCCTAAFVSVLSAAENFWALLVKVAGTYLCRVCQQLPGSTVPARWMCCDREQQFVSVSIPFNEFYCSLFPFAVALIIMNACFIASPLARRCLGLCSPSKTYFLM